MPPEADNRVDAEIERQLTLIREGALEVITEGDLRAKLRFSLTNNRPLLVKLGLDPTAPDIHLGHSVVLNKLRDFQILGHTVVFLVGDFTGRIGDPSGRSKTRPALDEAAIKKNAETYCDQAFKILDREKTLIDYNSRWGDAMSFADVIRLAAKYTLARMLERDDFAKRLAEGAPVSVHELLYPLAQAYDSVALKADVELGGSDQKFNLMVARDIQREYDQEPEIAVIMPLLVGTDGVLKMSKSLGNYVGITDAADDMFGKLMSVSDELMYDYFEILRLKTADEVARLRADVGQGLVHPKALKQELARRIVAVYRDDAAARAAQEEFDRVHAQHLTPEDIPTFTRTAPQMKVVDIIVGAGLAPSKSEARRLIAQKAVTIDGEPVSDGDAPAPFAGGEVIQVGKRRFVRIG